jgi:ribosomal protein S18 acetylase RimI-like enzyme
MRHLIRPITTADKDAVHNLLGRVAIFEPHEVQVAMELIGESLAGSPDYVIHVAENNDTEPRTTGVPAQIIGYVCHGHNPVTDALYDLYWIAVDPAMQGRGVGRALLTHAEACVRDTGGRGVVIDTSSRSEYAPARALYERSGYSLVAKIPDYYKLGDALLIYRKML